MSGIWEKERRGQGGRENRIEDPVCYNSNWELVGREKKKEENKLRKDKNMLSKRT